MVVNTLEDNLFYHKYSHPMQGKSLYNPTFHYLFAMQKPHVCDCPRIGFQGEHDVDRGELMGFINTVILDFFVALGIVLGGSIIGAIGALFAHNPPMTAMVRLAEQLKIWALVAALGGTMDTLKVFDTGVFGGQVYGALKQFFYLLAAFLGCNVGYYLIKWIVGDIKA